MSRDSGHGVVALGETMGLVRAVDIGALSTGPALRMGIGGAETNVLIGLARLGVPGTWIGCLGQDGVGDLVQRELRAEGVHARIRRIPTAPTGLMLKERPTALGQVVTYYRQSSAGSHLSPDDVRAAEAAIADAELLHLTGITLALSDSTRAAVNTAVDFAEQHGVPVSFDINHRSKLWPAEVARPHYLELAQRAAYLFAGVEEAAIITGVTPAPPGRPERLADTAAQLHDVARGELVVKDGAAGALVRAHADTHRAPALPVPVVDTVGAGDGFLAGYLSARLRGAGPAASLNRAIRTGAYACLAPGDWESLPHTEDLDALDATEPVRR